MFRSFLVVGLTGLTVLLCSMFPNAATDPQTGMVMKLPDEIPGHVGVVREVSEEERVWLPSDTQMLKRSYFPKGAESKSEAFMKSIAVTLILSGADQRSLHRPEVCLDGQGWAIVDQPIEVLQVNGKPLKVKNLYLERSQVQDDKSLKKIKAHYVYWWVGSHVNTADTAKRALISAKENIFYNRNTRWGYPSIMVSVDEDRGESRSDACRRAYAFVEQYGAAFLKNY